jgi:hypothetical protein
MLRFPELSGVGTVIDNRQDRKEAPAGRMDTGNWVVFWKAEEQWFALRVLDWALPVGFAYRAY